MAEKIDLFSKTEEHDMLRMMVRKFADSQLEPSALERDKKEYFDVSLFKKLGNLGLLGITAPVDFGGAGLDASAAVIVHEELSAVDPGFALAYLAHDMLCINNIAQNANTEQKQKYLPKLCTGEFLGAMAMSEPDVGTDVLGMKCQAQHTTDGYVINGRKMWITNGARDESGKPADVLYLYAKTGPARRDVSSFLIEAGFLGYSVGQHLKGKLGMRASGTAEIVLDDCLVAKSQLVGAENDALVHMMRNLELERLTLAAIGLGIARRCLVIMNDYVNTRTAFGKPLVSFGQIQKYIAESFAKYRASKAYVYSVAYNSDLKNAHGRMDSDGAKLMAATAAKEIADAAIQVLGGNGYMAEYVVERLWRDAKLLEIGGGTLEAHQKNIAYDLSKNQKVLLS